MDRIDEATSQVKERMLEKGYRNIEIGAAIASAHYQSTKDICRPLNDGIMQNEIARTIKELILSGQADKGIKSKLFHPVEEVDLILNQFKEDIHKHSFRGTRLRIKYQLTNKDVDAARELLYPKSEQE